jgi:type VI secretion system protein ImpL
MASLRQLMKRIPWSTIALLTLGVLVLVALVVLGFRFHWWQTLEQALDIWFWLGLVLLILSAVLVVLLWFVPRKREKRFLAELHAADKEQSEPGEQERYAKLQERMQEAVRTLRRSPELRKKEGLPLYALPWYLLLGAGNSGKTTLLRSVAKGFPPFNRLGEALEGPTQDCEWWFFNTAVILDTAHAYAFPLQQDNDGSLWYRLLRLLRHYREIQPINGLIITLAADACVTLGEEALRQEAVQLRRRIDEAIEELGIDFPIYLVVTRCDLLEGFTEFCDQLPTHMTQQVFGYLREQRPRLPGPPTNAPAVGGFDTLFHTLTERLRQLRLAIYNQEHVPTEALRQKIFCFPEEFQALQRPLGIVVETLFQVNPLRSPPFFRGLFFCSALQQGQTVSFLRSALQMNGHTRNVTPGAKAYFLHDIFSRILLGDQSLVRATGKASRSRRLRHLLGLGGCVALCGGVLLALTHAFVSDRHVRAALKPEACAIMAEHDTGAFDLQQAARCRKLLLEIGQRNQQRVSWSRFLFNRTGRGVQHLQERYVQRFAAAVLAPLDTQLEQRLQSGGDALPVVFLLIRRIELSQRCLGWRGCPLTLPAAQRPDYALMLSPTGEHAPSTEQTTTLQQTYEAYLHWATAKEEILRQESADHAERLRQWFASNKFALTQILSWANQRYPPITLLDLWPASPTQASPAQVRVDGAYTRDAWEQSLQPFLQRAEAAVPAMDAELKNFRDTYRTQYFKQWHDFLAHFPSGELPWWPTTEQRRALVPHLLSADSPYNQVFEVTFAHLKPHLPLGLVLQATPPRVPASKAGENKPQQTSLLKRLLAVVTKTAPEQQTEEGNASSPAGGEASPDVPVWVRVMGRYLGSAARQTYQATILQVGDMLADDPLREKSVKLAQTGFQEEVGQEEPKHPILKAAWLVRKFQQENTSTDEKPAQVLWPLLERPVLFVWKVILEQTGLYFQKRWTENVIAPAAGLAELERINFFYGPAGKVRAFVDEFLRPFLADNETRPRQVLDEGIPLSAAFLTTLHNTKYFRPVLEVGKQAPQRIRVEVLRPATVESQINITVERAEFMLGCAAQTFRVAMPSQEDAPASTTGLWSFDACGDVVMTTVLSCDRQCVERAAAVGMTVPQTSMLRLSMRYQGQEGFFRFVQDFRDGSHTFTLAAFADAYATAEWQKLQPTLRQYGISTVRMYFRVEVPPALEQLLALKSQALIATRIVQ